MKYYILKQDSRIEGQPKTSDCGNLDPLDFIDGKVLPVPGELHIKLSPRSSEYRGDIISGVSTLFHKNFIAELDRLGVDNIQFFPVHMHAPDGMIEKAFSMANVIGLVDAVDTDRSKIEPRAHGGIGTLYSFTIDEEKAKGLHIFRILHAPALIIIDEWLFEKLVAYNIPGVMMYPTEDYNGWS